MKKGIIALSALLLVMIAGLSATSPGLFSASVVQTVQQSSAPTIVKVLQGEVLVNNQKIQKETVLHTGDVVKTSAKSLAEIVFSDKSVSRLAENTELEMKELPDEKTGRGNILMKAISGEVWSKIMKIIGVQSTFEIQTETTVAAVRGSAFDVQVLPCGTAVLAAEHTVWFENSNGEKEAVVTEGKKATLECNNTDLVLEDAFVEMKSDWFQENVLKDAEHAIQAIQEIQQERENKVSIDPSSAFYFFQEIKDSFAFSESVAPESLTQNIDYVNKKLFELEVFLSKDEGGDASKILENIDTVATQVQGNLEFQSKLFSVLASHHESLFDAQVGTGLYDLRKHIESLIVSLASTKKEQEYIQGLVLARRVIDVYDALDSNVSSKVLEEEMQEVENAIVKLGMQSTLQEQFGTSEYADKVKEEVKVKTQEEIAKSYTPEEQKNIETIQKTLEKEKSGNLLEDNNYVYQEKEKETFVAPVAPVEQKPVEAVVKKEEPTFIEKVKEVVTDILPFQEEAEIKAVETPVVKQEAPVALAQEVKPVVIEPAVIQNTAPTLKKIKQDITVLLGDEKDLGKVSVLLEDKDSADEIESATFALNPEVDAKDAGVRFVWQKTKTPESLTCSGGGFIHQASAGFGKEFLQVRSCAVIKNDTQLQIDTDFTVSEKLKPFGENTFAVAFAKVNNVWNWQTVSHTGFSVLASAPTLEVNNEEAENIVWKWKAVEGATKYILASPTENVRYELLPTDISNVNGMLQFTEIVTEENQKIERKLKAVTAVAPESLHPFGAITSVFTGLKTPASAFVSVADRTSNSVKIIVKEPVFNAQLDQSGAEIAIFNAEQADISASVSKENIGKYQVIFNGLMPNTEYLVSVRYKNAVGKFSGFSEKKSVKTYNNVLGMPVCTPTTETFSENGKDWFGEKLEITCSFPEGFLKDSFKNARIQYKTDGTDPNCDAGESVWTSEEKKTWTENTQLQVRLCDDLGNKGDLLNKIFVKDTVAPSCSNINWTTEDTAGLDAWKATGNRAFTAEYASVADLESGITIPEVQDRTCSAGENKTCSVTLKDRAGNTTNCMSPVNNVDNQKPKSPKCSSASEFFASSVDVTCESPEDSGAFSSGNLSIRYKADMNEQKPDLTCSTGSVYTGNLPVSSTSKIGFIVCDGVGNASAISYVSVTKDDSKPECGTWLPAQEELDANIKNKDASDETFTLTGSTATSGVQESSYVCAVTGGKDNETCSVEIKSSTGQTNTCTSPKNRVDDTAPTVPVIAVDASNITTTSWFDSFFDSIFADDEAWKPLTKGAWTSLKKARVKIETTENSLTPVSYFYCVDAGAPVTKCNPDKKFVSSADFALIEGTNTIRVNACDGGGCSAVSEFLVKGDFTAPSCITGLKSADFTSGSVELTASNIDDGNGSGVDSTKQNSKFIAENGDHFVEVMDKAGNIARCASAKVDTIDTQSPKTGNWTLSNTEDKEFVWSVQCSDEKSGCKQDVYSCSIADQNAQCQITLEDNVGHKQQVSSPSTVYVSKWKAQYPNTEDEKNWECNQVECKIFANSFIPEELTAVASSAQTQPAPRSVFQTKTSYPLVYSAPVWSAFTCNEQNCQQFTEVIPTGWIRTNKNIQPAPMQNVVWSQTGTQNFVGRKTIVSSAWYKMSSEYEGENAKVDTLYCSNQIGDSCAENSEYVLKTKPTFQTGARFTGSAGSYSRHDDQFYIAHTEASKIAVCLGSETDCGAMPNSISALPNDAVFLSGNAGNVKQNIWYGLDKPLLSFSVKGESSQAQPFIYKVFNAQNQLIQSSKGGFSVAYCGAGEYLSGESCKPVEAGYFSPAHNNDSIKCSANHFCPGKIVNSQNQLVFNNLNALVLDQLAKTPSEKEEGAILCPEHTQNASGLNTNIQSCLADAGYYWNKDVLEITPVNTYSLKGDNGAHSCIDDSQPAGSYSYEGVGTCAKISLSPVQTSVFVGETVKFTASAVLKTGESYAWYFGNNCQTPISGQSGKELVQSFSTATLTAPQNISARLVLAGATGVSKCTSVSLNVQTIPSPVSVTVAETANTLTVNWPRIDFNGLNIINYKVDIVRGNQFLRTEVLTCITALCSYAMNTFDRNTDYTFAVYSDGSSNKKTSDVFTTSAVVGSFSVGNITTNSVEFTFVGVADSYNISSATAGVNQVVTGTSTIISNIPVGTHTFIITAINKKGFLSSSTQQQNVVISALEPSVQIVPVEIAASANQVTLYDGRYQLSTVITEKDWNTADVSCIRDWRLPNLDEFELIKLAGKLEEKTNPTLYWSNLHSGDAGTGTASIYKISGGVVNRPAPIAKTTTTNTAFVCVKRANTINMGNYTITVADADEGIMSWMSAYNTCYYKGRAGEWRLPNNKAEFDAMKNAGMLSGSVYWGGEVYSILKSYLYRNDSVSTNYYSAFVTNTFLVRCVK